MAVDRGARARIAYLDNLKWALIAGIIVSHAATAYGAIGGWFYVEPTLNPVTRGVFSGLTVVGNLFALGTFMLVAGLLTPPALARKGVAKFAGDRLLGLGVPFAATVVLISPFVVWMIVAVTGYPLTLTAFAQWQLRWLDPGPMWFVAVLLFYSLCYAGWCWVRPPAGESEARPLRMRHVLVAALLIAVLTFLVRLAFPVGSPQPLNASLWEWPQLAVLFIVGVLAGERHWLAARVSRAIRTASWVAPPAALAVLFVTIAASRSDLSSPSALALYSGGWHWQSALASGVEGVVAVGASLALIDLFRQVGNWHGRLARTLSRESYTAYFLQMPVLIVLELSLFHFAWPGEVKLALTAPIGIAICFAAPWAVRRAFAAATTRGNRTPASRLSLGRGPHHPPAGC